MPAPILISNLRGGRNGVDSPTDPEFPKNQCVEAKNVDFYTSPLGGTRGGSTNLSLAGGTAFGNGIRFLCRHVPSGDEGGAELWGVDGNGVVKRLRNGVNWADVTLDDAITGEYDKVVGVSFNGKLFLFYKSVVSRLHVFDPLLNKVRRVGINPGTAVPTITNAGGVGTLAGARYYRNRFLQMNGLICVRKSEPTPASALFTPGGANLYARVTRPALPGEGETHWEVEIATVSTGPWNQVQGVDQGTPIDIASTYFDDATTTAGIAALPASDPAGMYALFPAAKFGITDNNRLITAGSWLITSEPNESRIWLSPVLGSDDRGDDERWVNETDLKLRIDTSEKNGGSITGLVGPVNGVFWSAKYRQVWRHMPTSDLFTPYLTRQISAIVGVINQHACLLAEDVKGNPAAYITSHRGLYRLGIEGLVYLGRDVEDIWQGFGDYTVGVNLAATIPAHIEFHTDIAQIYLWIATGANDYPNLRLRLDVKQAITADAFGIRGGWAVDDGEGAKAYCSCLFADSIDATMGRKLKPFIGRADTTVWKCDSTAETDAGTTFQSTIKTASIVPAEVMLKKFDVKESILVADASTGNSIRQTLIGDFGVNEKVTDKGLDPKKTESIVIRKFGASMTSEMGAIQVKLGDAVAIASTWSLHALILPLSADGDQ